MQNLIVLSHFQARLLLEAREAGAAVVAVSPDLGISTTDIRLEAGGVVFPGGERLGWEAVDEIVESDSGCFRIENGEAHKIQTFSEETGRVYTLYPTELAPTMLVSGIPMHRIKGTNPHKDTLSKINTIRPVTGRVLDCNMGLGYTAIAAAKTAERVTTIELDPAVVEICRQNPWSQDLLNNPRITRVIGDSFDVVETLDDGAFTRIIHDPPTFSLAGHLYSEDFYAELYRVLARGGRLFHYIGDLESASGSRVVKGAIRRLQSAGFGRVQPRKEAFGLVAYK